MLYVSFSQCYAGLQSVLCVGFSLCYDSSVGRFRAPLDVARSARFRGGTGVQPFCIYLGPTSKSDVGPHMYRGGGGTNVPLPYWEVMYATWCEINSYLWQFIETKEN